MPGISQGLKTQLRLSFGIPEEKSPVERTGHQASVQILLGLERQLSVLALLDLPVDLN